MSPIWFTSSDFSFKYKSTCSVYTIYCTVLEKPVVTGCNQFLPGPYFFLKWRQPGPQPDATSDDHGFENPRGFRVGYAGVRVRVSLCQPSTYPYPHGGLSNPRSTRTAG